MRRDRPVPRPDGDDMSGGEYCRNWLDNDTNPHRCGAPADCIVWGKLIDPEAIGPRCYPCAESQLGYREAHDRAYAVYHFASLAASKKATT